MTISWPNLLRTARRMVNLTQEDFGADLGRSQSAVALWELGKRPIPPAVRRRVLDIHAGYYHRRPEYGALLAETTASLEHAAIYRPGLVIQAANSTLLSSWHELRLDLTGTSILPFLRTESRLLGVVEQYLLPMLEGRSEVISVSFLDRSLLLPGCLVQRNCTVYQVGAGRLLVSKDQLIRNDAGADLTSADVQVVTTDDTAE